MNSSSWKLPNLSSSFFSMLNSGLDKPNLVWSRSSMMISPFVGSVLSIYNGSKFVTVRVKKSLLGCYSGEFCMSKLLGSKMHLSKKSKKVNPKS